MTERADFYIAADNDARAAEVYACRLAEKAWGLGHRVYVHTADAEAARRLDQLLWTFAQGSFVPHRQLDDAHNDSVDGDPVVIGYAEPQGDGGRAVLINLQAGDAEWFNNFARVAEVVGGGEDAKVNARARYKKYKSAGVEVAVHNL